MGRGPDREGPGRGIRRARPSHLGAPVPRIWARSYPSARPDDRAQGETRDRAMQVVDQARDSGRQVTDDDTPTTPRPRLSRARPAAEVLGSPRLSGAKGRASRPLDGQHRSSTDSTGRRRAATSA